MPFLFSIDLVSPSEAFLSHFGTDLRVVSMPPILSAPALGLFVSLAFFASSLTRILFRFLVDHLVLFSASLETIFDLMKLEMTLLQHTMPWQRSCKEISFEGFSSLLPHRTPGMHQGIWKDICPLSTMSSVRFNSSNDRTFL